MIVEHVAAKSATIKHDTRDQETLNRDDRVLPLL